MVGCDSQASLKSRALASPLRSASPRLTQGASAGVLERPRLKIGAQFGCANPRPSNPKRTIHSSPPFTLIWHFVSMHALQIDCLISWYTGNGFWMPAPRLPQVLAPSVSDVQNGRWISCLSALQPKLPDRYLQLSPPTRSLCARVPSTTGQRGPNHPPQPKGANPKPPDSKNRNRARCGAQGEIAASQPCLMVSMMDVVSRGMRQRYLEGPVWLPGAPAPRFFQFGESWPKCSFTACHT